MALTSPFRIRMTQDYVLNWLHTTPSKGLLRAETRSKITLLKGDIYHSSGKTEDGAFWLVSIDRVQIPVHVAEEFDDSVPMSRLLEKVRPQLDRDLVDLLGRLVGDHWVSLTELQKELNSGTDLWDNGDVHDPVMKEVYRRLATIPIHTWLCHDTFVGVHAIYFDGNFAALTFQSARKSEVEYRWVSLGMAEQVRTWLRSIDPGYNSKPEVLVFGPDDRIDPKWLDEEGD